MNAYESTPARRANSKPAESRRRAAGRKRRRRPLLRVFRFLLSAVLLAAVYFTAMSGWILYHWKHAQGAPGDSIVVLGAAVWNQRPSPALRERLEIALRLYEEGKAPRIIVTGGSAGGEPSEAAVSKAYLTDKGVPETAVILEDQSYSTIENLLNARSLMERHGFRDAIIVTHGFHALRAQMMADHLALPATVEPVQVTPLNLVYYTLRECAGIAFFQIQRWFL